MREDIIAVIPARGGSKGIRLKNIAMLGNKTLLEHTICHALASRLLGRIIVSTDNKKIALVASGYRRRGVEVFKRPRHISGDEAPMAAVLKHVLNEIKKSGGAKPRLIVTLQPTAPFRDPSSIDKAIRLALGRRFDSVVAICRSECSPFKMFVMGNQGLRWFIPSKLHSNNNRQLFPATYRGSGTVYVSQPDLIKEKNTVIGGRIGYIMVDALQSVDINGPFDLEVARALYKRKR
jgi:N-acylneuraminate cytidylyltransferase/CMP-N,N'-diacetyllegionaminic acid synthase